MTEEIYLNWFKMCVAGKLCPGANNRIDSQEKVTLSEQTGAATQTPFSLFFSLRKMKGLLLFCMKADGRFWGKGGIGTIIFCNHHHYYGKLIRSFAYVISDSQDSFSLFCKWGNCSPEGLFPQCHTLKGRVRIWNPGLSDFSLDSSP